jgi:hypothetical protein
MLFKASPEEPGLKIKHKDQGGEKSQKDQNNMGYLVSMPICTNCIKETKQVYGN